MYPRFMVRCRLLDIGRMEFGQALALMRALVLARQQRPPETLIFLEHDPVVTLGKRGQLRDLRLPAAFLAAQGLGLFRIERGGLVTCHGPGQLVAYPVFHLPTLGLGVAEMVKRMQESILDTLSDFGISGELRAGHPGVWAGSQKVASLGLAVRRGVSFHGLALNRDPDLAFFDLINPCGLVGESMTSMVRELGCPVDEEKLRRQLTVHFARRFGLDLIPVSLAEMEEELGLPSGTELP